ncbi:MAG: PKD domain-containing protein [Chloroflexota bacterium]
MQKLTSHTKGQALIEYVGILATVSIAIIFVMNTLGDEITDSYKEMRECLIDSINCREPLPDLPTSYTSSSSSNSSSNSSPNPLVSVDTNVDIDPSNPLNTSVGINTNVNLSPVTNTPNDITDILGNDSENTDTSNTDESAQCRSAITFEEFDAGTTLTTQIDGALVSSLTQSLNPPLVVDNSSLSGSITGRSLVVGQLSIIGEASTSLIGGQLFIEFDSLVNVSHMMFVDTGLIDVASVQFFASDSITSLKALDVKATIDNTDNGLIRVDVDQANVKLIGITIATVGALDAIYFCDDEASDDLINVDGDINPDTTTPTNDTTDTQAPVQTGTPPTVGINYNCNDRTCNFWNSFQDDGWQTAILWDFGDGTTATSNGSHTFDYGDYTVTLTMNDNDGLTGTATLSLSFVDLPDPEMRISNLEAQGYNSNGNNWYASVWVTIVNESGNPVQNATLGANFSRGGYKQCTTNSQGRCELVSNNINGNQTTQVTLTINNVWGGQNAPFNRNDSVTSVTISKP